MLTVGVDLAADPAKTGMCAVDWAGPEILVHARPITDDQIVDAVVRADVTGFDVPLGWPDGFIDAITAHRDQRGWPPVEVEPPEDREALRVRLTDLFEIATGARPLSVSTDRIGVAAMRGARLQDLLVARGVQIDRSGVSGALVETYPAGALRTWGLRSVGYKGPANRAILEELIEDFAAKVGPSGPRIGQASREFTDDDFDAVICAVVARGARQGETVEPGPEHLDRARREGWIHSPIAALRDIITE